MVIIKFNQCPVLIGQQSILGFVVLALHVLCHSSKPAAVIVTLCRPNRMTPRAKTGPSLTPLIESKRRRRVGGKLCKVGCCGFFLPSACGRCVCSSGARCAPGGSGAGSRRCVLIFARPCVPLTLTRTGTAQSENNKRGRKAGKKHYVKSSCCHGSI